MFIIEKLVGLVEAIIDVPFQIRQLRHSFENRTYVLIRHFERQLKETALVSVIARRVEKREVDVHLYHAQTIRLEPGGEGEIRFNVEVPDHTLELELESTHPAVLIESVYLGTRIIHGGPGGLRSMKLEIGNDVGCLIRVRVKWY